MKLRSTREHFMTPDRGGTWVPKKGFESEQDVLDHNFNMNNWKYYICSICSKYHVSKINQKRNHNND